ncbi:MAG: S49 family peptidase [Gammaproteobacteria bacterium]|nr:MAG: S49 family peptidase [Gammaproteobacteria bacterium]
MKYPHIAARLFNQPLLIESGKLSTIVAALGPRFNADIDWGMADPAYARQTVVSETGYKIVDGVAVIPVVGTLVHRGSTPNAMSGLTGYDALSKWFQAAMNDPAVNAILLELDTPGGEVAGAFDFADQIHAARGQKPVTAMVSDLAASAGYLIASAAGEIVTTRTGRTGSVGVVTAHIDYSKALNNEGVVVTHIYSGAHKVDGHPFAPLPEEVKARWQADIQSLYQLFVQTVARNRGMTIDAVQATEALVYMGDAAVSMGFADKVSTLEATLAAMRTTPDRKAGRGMKLSKPPKESRMEKDDKNNPIAGITESQLDSAVAQAKTEERERIKAIMKAEAATGRAEMAEHLAFETGMTATDAIALLGKAPVVKTETPKTEASSALAKAMAAIEQPNITAADADTALDPASPKAKADAIIHDFKRATGKK